MRTWIISGLIVAALVTVYLIATGEDRPKKPGAREAIAPSPLSQSEIRTYLAVWPKINQALQRAAGHAIRRHQKGDVDPKALGEAGRAAVDAILQEHHLTRAAWKILSNRVEYAVERIRWDLEVEKRNAALDQKIQQKEALLEIATGKAKVLLEGDIADLKNKRAFGGPPLSEQDIALVNSFWRSLSPVVPPRGQPQKKK